MNAVSYVFVPRGNPLPLHELRPGSLFLHGDALGFKSEYGGNDSRVDAYLLASGEAFWGGTSDPLAQRAILVQPLMRVDREVRSVRVGTAPANAALTLDQWDRLRIDPMECGLVVHDDGDGLEFLVPQGPSCRKFKIEDWEPENRHGLAALALNGREYGFTWTDVDALRRASVTFNYGDDSIGENEEATALVRNVADRIAALLPPRDQQ